MMGDKARARAEAKKLGLPAIPGSEGAVENPQQAHGLARAIGYPVILKAAAGGGGRGMRVVRDAAEIEMAFQTASSEAQIAFGDSRVYMEKYIENPRHIEIQILADSHGNAIQLGERECSIQRKHQKIIEEAPSMAVSEALREEMGRAATALVRAIGYENAGTIEFLLDEDGSYYFMEMNTRIQVEHPVTELVTGMDLIKEQIHIAAGLPMSPFPQPFFPRGHAMECRITAEDPETFAPSPGQITVFHPPGGLGVRVDTAMYAGAVVPPYYDSMIAKLITHGRNREESIQRMRRCLDVFVIEGIKTNIPLHMRVMQDGDFQAGRLSTRFLERFLAKTEP
jgi:acetyl-CoA carboxylase biotin carboxylase subunit